MANTYTCLHYHIVFSTRGRRRWIHCDIEERVWEYIGGIASKNQLKPVRIGGIEDHVHVLVGAPPTIAVSRIAQLLKGGSSHWIRESFSRLDKFTWQDGYGAFSVSKSQLDEVSEYIASQREHHRTRTFQEEFRLLLRRHGVEFDERYVWG